MYENGEWTSLYHPGISGIQYTLKNIFVYTSPFNYGFEIFCFSFPLPIPM